jgi:hypothetical protein
MYHLPPSGDFPEQPVAENGVYWRIVQKNALLCYAADWWGPHAAKVKDELADFC